jgi:hypothetical protein
MIRFIPRTALAFAFVLPLAGCPSGGTDEDTTDTSTDDEVGTETADTTADTTADETADTTADTGDGDSVCAHQCATDDDCLVMGMDQGLTCQDSFCTGEASGCTDNAECVALYSGWTTACTSGGGECDMLAQVCVQGPDGGLCATPPSDFFMCETVPGWTEMTVPDIDGNDVTVCGNAEAECNADGICIDPCGSDADCTSPSYPVCNTDTGLCGCGDDSHCAMIGEPHLSVCLPDGACGCGEDQQCADGGVGDVCLGSGFCGCSGDAACEGVTNPFDGGMISCVMP